MFARWREVLTTITPVAVLGTLVCCAIPITLVTVGAGSVVASLVASCPPCCELLGNGREFGSPPLRN